MASGPDAVPHDVFISYSTKDKPSADAACAVLEGAGIRCWIAPRDITPGADWSESILDALAEVKVLVLVFSAHANASRQITREVERAVNRGIPVIPLRIEDVAPVRSLEFFISTPHWLDAFSPPLQKHLTYLAQIVQRLLDGEDGLPRPLPPPPTPSPPPVFGRLKPWSIAAGAALALVVAVFAFRSLKPATSSVTAADSSVSASSVAAAGPVPEWGGCDEIPTVDGCSVIIQDGHETPQNMAVAYIRRAIAYHGAGDLQRAIEDDDQAIRLTPESAIAFGNRGASYEDLGKTDQAIHDYDEAIRLKPDFARAFSNRCFARARANQALGQALADCDQALKLAPDDVNTLGNRGLVRLRMGQLDPALADVDAALAIDPQQANPLYLRGLVKRAKGDVAGAAADIAAAKALNTNIANQFASYGLTG